MKLSIVIPAYNEERTVATLLDKVLAIDLSPVEKEIIVVNDGSRDGTGAVLKKYADRVVVMTHEKNRGKGASVRTGFSKATGDYVVVQDADLEYNPVDFRAMLAFAQKNNAPVVFGSRWLPHPEGGQRRGSFRYYLGGQVLTLLTNFLYGTRITDEPTCYKMMHRDVLSRITLSAEGFEFCPEITAKIARLGIPIVEVPIRYAPRSLEEGKKIRPRDGLIAIWTLIKNRF
jgi:glycosyltransferase involved in cell wall biosynthesis